MTLVLADWWLLGVAGALALILIGFLLVAWGLKARPARAALTLKNPTAADMSS
jgi:hypothetical protein